MPPRWGTIRRPGESTLPPALRMNWPTGPAPANGWRRLTSAPGAEVGKRQHQGAHVNQNSAAR